MCILFLCDVKFLGDWLKHECTVYGQSAHYCKINITLTLTLMRYTNCKLSMIYKLSVNGICKKLMTNTKIPKEVHGFCRSTRKKDCVTDAT